MTFCTCQYAAWAELTFYQILDVYSNYVADELYLS